MMMFEKDDASSLSHDGIKSLLAYGSQVTTEQLHTKDERKQEILKPLFKKKKKGWKLRFQKSSKYPRPLKRESHVSLQCFHVSVFCVFC